MRIFTTTLLISTLALSACGRLSESRINPVNWFGKGRTERAAAPVNDNPLLPQNERGGLFGNFRAQEEIYRGTPVDQVTHLAIEPVPGGAVIRATGIAAVQGVYDIQLTPENEQEAPVDGVLTYRLEGVKPEVVEAVGSAHTRRIVAARVLTHQQLQSVRRIVVQGARKSQSRRR